MKKVVSIILLFLMFLLIIHYGQISFAQTLTLGDINQDSEISVQDVSLLKLYLIDKMSLKQEQITLADLNQDNKITLTDFILLKWITIGKIELPFVENTVYEVELERFNIRNDGTIWDNNGLGMTSAIEYAEEKGYQEVKFPKGTYVIKAPNPISISAKNLVINWNDSTIKMQEENHNSYWTMMELKDPAENLVIKNGILQGNRFSNQFDTTNPYNEGTVPFSIKAGNDITMENLIIKDSSGYGMTIETGMNRTKKVEIWANEFELGSISDSGEDVENPNTMRSKKMYQVGDLGGEFEIGYTAGYQGYGSILNQEYKAYFYDKDKKFIGMATQKQYVKSSLPSECEYIRLVISQTQIKNGSEGVAFITNAKTFRNSVIKNCVFDASAAVGIAIGGGQNFAIEDCKFTRNGIDIDGRPALSAKVAIDIEDGWECMQNITLRRNEFTDNRYDFTSCAGDNLLLEENNFTNGCSIYARSTNYNIINNTFRGAVDFGISMGGNVHGNTYQDASIHTFYQRFGNDTQTYFLNMYNETFYNSSVYAQNLDSKKQNQVVKNSTVITKDKKVWIKGTFENCIFTNAGIYNSAILKHCQIQNTNIYAQGLSKYEDCIFENGNMITNSAEEIEINHNKITNFPIEITSWANAVKLTIEDSTLINTDNTKQILRLSAGKAKEIILARNKISSTGGMIEFFDTTYSLPKGKLSLIENTIKIPKDTYAVIGKKIESGEYKIECKGNILENTLLDLIYQNSKHLNIIIER